jgi:8-oxo-dGTP diphosphatase
VLTGVRAFGQASGEGGPGQSRVGSPAVTVGILPRMTTTPDAAAPFSRIKLRVSALVFRGDDVALIRRDRAGSTHYTTIGGNVETAEPLPEALRRELAEELALDIDQAEGGDLLWIVDQRVSRPGATPPPRKLHLIYRFHVTTAVRNRLARRELDELPDGSYQVGTIEWVDYRQTADLPIFPPIGPSLARLPSPYAIVADAALPAVTDHNYRWR